jgi:hypothetical protein
LRRRSCADRETVMNTARSAPVLSVVLPVHDREAFLKNDNPVSDYRFPVSYCAISILKNHFSISYCAISIS